MRAHVLPSFLRRLLAVSLCALGACLAASTASAQNLTLFAAVSMKDVLDEIVRAHEPGKGVRILTAYASSSALARQIEQGAPADVFVAADLDWMDYLDRRRLVDSASRTLIAGNRLVLVAASNRELQVEIVPGFALASLLQGERLAIADPAHVPAGRYARAALTHLGVWESVRSKLAPVDNVRAALDVVARAQAPLGIVYATDAKAERRVRVVGVFPADSHPEIRYPAAVVAASRQPELARRLLAHLRSPPAVAAFERRGFIPVR